MPAPTSPAPALPQVAAASTPEGSRHLSGMRLLPDGDQAFEARIALARAAEKTIDAQYYQIADDTSGRQFLRELSAAAARGVRVRLLVDDLHAAGEDALLAGLAARPNVELRMFNPLPVRDGSVGSRVLFSLHQFSRVNRRMHNKLMVADNVFAISGGRNIANEYFGRSEPANFIDMDLLSAGPVVQELSAVFDGYWNSEHAYPIQRLAAQDGRPGCRAPPLRRGRAGSPPRSSCRWQHATRSARAAWARNWPVAASSCTWPASACSPMRRARRPRRAMRNSKTARS